MGRAIRPGNVVYNRADTEQSDLGLSHYLRVLRRRGWLVALVFAATVAAAATGTFLKQPIYRASTKIVIGQGNALFQPNLSQAVQPFSTTMSDLLTSHIVARKVIDNLSLRLSEEELLNKINVSIKPESSALTVAVDDHDRNRARAIAAEIGTVFAGLVRERFGKPTPVGQGQQPLPPLTATVWDPAHIDPRQVAPRPARNIAIGAALGLVLGLLAGFLRDHLDRAVRTREEVEESYGAPVIGQVPFVRRPRSAPHAMFDPMTEAADAYRALRANLQYLAVGRQLKRILITSATPEQGKTTVTANLAVTIANSGASAIALECDLRRPSLDVAFGVNGDNPGLTNVLIDSSTMNSAIVELSSIGGDDRRSGPVRRLSLLASGPLPPNPSELLSSARMGEVLDELSEAYEYVLIDSPPILLASDALELARLVDGVLLVVRRNHATTDEAAEVRSLVERLDIPLVGIVFADVKITATYYGYRYTPRPGDARRGPAARTPTAARQQTR